MSLAALSHSGDCCHSLPACFLGLRNPGAAFWGLGAGGLAAVVGAPPIGESLPLAGMAVLAGAGTAGLGDPGR
jgi:hypothetical protein